MDEDIVAAHSIAGIVKVFNVEFGTCFKFIV